MFKKAGLLVAVAVVGAATAYADSPRVYFERLKESGFKIAVYNESGRYVGEATAKPENWKDSELTQYVVRWESGQVSYQYSSNGKKWQRVEKGDALADLTKEEIKTLEAAGGRFVTGFRGQIEKFDIGKAKEQNRLVIRNGEGEFVTWIALDGELKSSWNRRKEAGSDESAWWYETRYKAGSGLGGEIVNAVKMPAKHDAKEFVRHDNVKCPVLTIRDTEDGPNNGKFLTALWGVYYKDSKLCIYYPPSDRSEYLEPGEESKRIASFQLK
jgi:hypothetical protein